MSKGDAVYIAGTETSANYPRILLADADTEPTSSKTMGLLLQDLAINAYGYIVCDGILEGVDTSAATAGQSVWLSGTPGGRVYGAPPAKPAHGVYLGVVIRSNGSTGKIQVKVQNGYELDELHNVVITGTPADNEVFAYDDASSTWINQTASEAGLATASHTHALDDLTDVTAPTPSSNDVLTWNGTAWVNATPAVSLPSQTGNAGELLVTNGTDASWSNTVQANSASVPAIIAKGASGQTANVQEWQDFTGTVIASIKDGGIFTGGAARIGTNSGTTAYLNVGGSSSGAVRAIIKGASGQTANLTEWQDSSSTVLASISSAGLLSVKPTAGIAATSASTAGYIGMPQVSTATGLSLTATHAGKHIYTTATGQTHTIPANGSVALEIGTTIVFVNPASVTTTIAITSDTMYLAGTGTTGSRTLAPYGMATALKITSTSWIISGNGLT